MSLLLIINSLCHITLTLCNISPGFLVFCVHIGFIYVMLRGSPATNSRGIGHLLTVCAKKYCFCNIFWQHKYSKTVKCSAYRSYVCHECLRFIWCLFIMINRLLELFTHYYLYRHQPQRNPYRSGLVYSITGWLKFSPSFIFTVKAYLF